MGEPIENGDVKKVLEQKKIERLNPARMGTLQIIADVIVWVCIVQTGLLLLMGIDVINPIINHPKLWP